MKRLLHIEILDFSTLIQNWTFQEIVMLQDIRNKEGMSKLGIVRGKYNWNEGSKNSILIVLNFGVGKDFPEHG